jgi:hypothetical protein
MTALEEIQSAIVILTELRDERDYCEMNGWLAQTRLGASGAIDDPGYEGLTNDPLIVTLYRTIDAQLEILQEATDFYENSQKIGMPDTEIFEYYGAAYALARAINGEG